MHLHYGKEHDPVPDGHVYFAIAPFAWGKGATPEEAEKNCRVNLTTYVPINHLCIFLAPDSITVDGMGTMFWKEDSCGCKSSGCIANMDDNPLNLYTRREQRRKEKAA